MYYLLKKEIPKSGQWHVRFLYVYLYDYILGRNQHSLFVYVTHIFSDITNDHKCVDASHCAIVLGISIVFITISHT